MPILIDNIELDETNIEFNNAVDFVKHTDRIIYLTGKAGTGKTTFLKYLKQITGKKTIVVAPTGVAAINAGGQTIHSFFQIKPSVYIPNDRRLRKQANLNELDRSTIFDHFSYSKEQLELIREMEMLIIDEISMVRCDLLDVLDRLLRVYRRRESEPFGGVQVILIGDTFQLPPIAKSDEWEILSNFYESSFFFSSRVIKENKPIYIELKKIYRQNEKEFIELLNRVRVNEITQNELEILNSKFHPTFIPNENSNYITLATHNNIVNNTNLTKLNELHTELHLYEAVITGTFPDNILPTERVLQLKEHAQIMFIKNDRQRRFYNGKIAKIKSIIENEIIVEFSEGDEITIEKETWNNIRYTWNEQERKIKEEIVGTFTQFPVRLAWAITVHKSQGLTFEKVVADLGAAFTSGQVYVALSRCTSFNGLILKSRIDRTAIKTDSNVLNFAKNETPDTLILQELNAGKADFYYKKARQAIQSEDFALAFDHFISAIKFRNDIETDVFKRYVVNILLRFAKSKRLNSTILEQLKLKETEITNLNIANQEQKVEVEKQILKNSEVNSAVKLLLEKTKEIEIGKNIAEKEIFDLRAELSKVTRSLYANQIQKEMHKKQIEEQLKIISTLEQEIDRLGNLKWYQKMFGAK